MSLFLARKPYISDSGGKLRNHCIGCWLLLQSKLSITDLRRYTIKVKVKGKVIACTPAHTHTFIRSVKYLKAEKSSEWNWTELTRQKITRMWIHVRTEDINATPSAIRWISSDPCSKSGCINTLNLSYRRYMINATFWVNKSYIIYEAITGLNFWSYDRRRSRNSIIITSAKRAFVC